MNANPVISVIMSTYNTPNEWLQASIESILNQTFSDFEFLIIDDCSTESLETVKQQFTDKRIIWTRNENNLGLTKSLNKLLGIARGKYIARMDADDIAMPERFAEQVDFMEHHTEVIVCGTWRRSIGKESKNEIWNLPETREEQQVKLFFSNIGLTHPTAMFRKSMLDRYGIAYNENYKKAQDYGIWVQCTRYAPMAMLHKVLLKYRKSDGQVTANRSGVRTYDSMIKTDQLLAIGLNATDEEKEMHIHFCNNEPVKDVDALRKWITRLEEMNSKSAFFAQNLFREELMHRWYQYCRQQYLIEKNVSYKAYYQETRTLQKCFDEVILHVKQRVARCIGR